jgi:hypothetical protein
MGITSLHLERPVRTIKPEWPDAKCVSAWKNPPGMPADFRLAAGFDQ